MSTENSQQTIKFPEKLTGAIRMGASFNPGKDPRIDRVKQVFAELHDLIDGLSKEHIANNIHPDNKVMQVEAGRACATALTNLQTAKMYAVEALTR